MTTHLLSTRTRRWSVVVATLAVTATLATSSSGAAASPPAGLTPVSQGAGAAPLQAAPSTGATPGSTPMDVSIVLRARHFDTLGAKVTGGWTGPFLTTAQFASTYGQTPDVVATIQKYLHGFGITTSAYSDRLLIHAHGTAAQFDKAMNVALKNYKVSAPNANGDGSTHQKIVHGTMQNPRIPSAWADKVLAILGLSNYAPFVSHATPAPRRAINRHPATTPGIPAGMQTPARLHQALPPDAAGGFDRGGSWPDARHRHARLLRPEADLHVLEQVPRPR